jgi:hypothetical protein
MTSDQDQTNPPSKEFDYSSYPHDSLFYDRREGRDRRHRGDAATNGAARPTRPAPAERREKKERRRRIDPTTFEKQYSDDELEFMNAMQRFKERSGKSFPTHAEVLKVAIALGYRLGIDEPDSTDDEDQPVEETDTADSTVTAFE